MATSTKTTSKKDDKIKVTPVYIPSPAKVYTQNIGRSRAPGMLWEAPEWDLAEISRILDTESIVRRAFKAKKNLFLKEGFEFVGKTPERIKYIEGRFQQIEEATNTPFPILISQTGNSLIRYKNAFWVKVRKTNRSGGKERKFGNKVLQPVAGYFPIAAETIRFKRNENGKIVKYKPLQKLVSDRNTHPIYVYPWAD